MLLLAVLAGCEREVSLGTDVVVRIGDQEIAYREFESYLRATLEEEEPTLDAQALSRLFDQFLDGRLLVRLAIDRGLPEKGADPRRATLFLLRGEADSPVDEAAAQAYYDAHREEYQQPERVHLRQILVDDRSLAEEALAVLATGEDFAAVAKRLSQGPKAHLGGDQGWLTREDLPLPFAEIIDQLGPGQYSEIAAAEYGFHIFQVVARSPAEVVPFAEVEDEIRRTLERRHIDDLVASFLKAANERYHVEIYPPNFPFNYRGSYDSRSQS